MGRVSHRLLTIALLSTLSLTACSVSPKERAPQDTSSPASASVSPGAGKKSVKVIPVAPVPGELPEVPEASTKAITQRDIPLLLLKAKDLGCSIDHVSLKDYPEILPGNAQVDGNVISISKYLPVNEAESMIIHECAHIRQQEVMSEEQIANLNLIYPPYTATFTSMPKAEWTPPEGYEEKPLPVVISGKEQNADCMARLNGATVFFYTLDCEGERGEAAKDILEDRVPEGVSGD